MKKSEKKTEIKVKPRRLTRAERKQAKEAQKAYRALQLCTQAAEFHKTYLTTQLECEGATLDALNARLAELQQESENSVAVRTRGRRRRVPKKESIIF